MQNGVESITEKELLQMLSGNKRNERQEQNAKSRYGVFDIESNEWVKFEVMGCFDGQEYKKFTSVKKFLDHIDSKGYDGFRWYAHNAGRFDDLFLLADLLSRNYDVKIVPRQSRIIAIRVKTSRCSYTICDSYALLPDSLKRLSTAFQVEHQKKEHDVSGHNSKHDKRLLQYLENDCLCLYEVLQKFFQSDFVAQPQLTIASQALNTFRNFFVPHSLYRINLADEDIFRSDFYSGGRVEVYKGAGTVNTYDVNSLYPFVMLQEMPTGHMKHTSRFERGKIGFYKVEILSTPDWYISPLLIKRKKNYFVNGRGEYFLSSATLEYLKKEFGIRFKVLQGYVFPSREDLFTEYVQTFYQMKRENKGNAKYIIAKLFLNSLYGKMGQMRWHETIVPIKEAMKRSRKHPGDDRFAFTSVDGLEDYGLVMVKEETRSKFICPYIAAYITELARLHHFKLMMEHPGSMYYCDTDSLFTTARYKTGTGLGELSFEGRFEYIGLSPKNYALKNVEDGSEEIAFKGFSADEFSFSDFRKAQQGKKVLKQTTTRPLSFTEAKDWGKRKDTSGLLVNAGRFLKSVSVTKQITGTYDKRQVLPSARFVFDTKPFNYF